MSVVLRQHCKWLPCPCHGHPWKWVQGSIAEMVLATVQLVWVGLVLLLDRRVERAQLFNSLQRLYRQLQWPPVGITYAVGHIFELRRQEVYGVRHPVLRRQNRLYEILMKIL